MAECISCWIDVEKIHRFKFHSYIFNTTGTSIKSGINCIAGALLLYTNNKKYTLYMGLECSHSPFAFCIPILPTRPKRNILWKEFRSISEVKVDQMQEENRSYYALHCCCLSRVKILIYPKYKYLCKFLWQRKQLNFSIICWVSNYWPKGLQTSTAMRESTLPDFLKIYFYLLFFFSRQTSW